MPPPRIARSVGTVPKRQRAGMDDKHTTGVGDLPCIACGSEAGVQAHHLLRTGEKGMGRKSSDQWCIPLCWKCHDPNQAGSLHHNGNEEAWLAARGIDGRGIARTLWEQRHDQDAMRRVVERSLISRRIYVA